MSPGVCLNSCPLSHWCHPTISSSVVPFSSCPQSFLASGSFQMSQLLASGGQSIGTWASASILPMNIQNWFPLGLTGLISLQSKRLSRVFSSTTVQKHQFFGAQPSSWFNSHFRTWLLEKPWLWLYGCLLAKCCLCFSIHCLGLSWLSFQAQHCVRTTQRRGGAFPRSQAKCYFHRKSRDLRLPAAQTQREQAPARDAAEHKTMRTDFGAGWPRRTPVLPGPSSVTLNKWPHLSVPRGPHL